MAWRFVRTPDGRLARFSEVVDNLTAFALSDEDAKQICLEHGVLDIDRKVAAADSLSDGQTRWDEVVGIVRAVHGARKLRDLLIEIGLPEQLAVVAPLSSIDGLLDAESPLEWACANLELVDRGDHAYVFSHPDDESVVIRVSDYPDGAFGYADRLLRKAVPGAGEHGPIAFDMVHVEGYFIGTFERLQPIDEDVEALEWVRVAAAFIRREPVSEQELDKLRNAQPGLFEFLQHVGPVTDTRVSNWMLRDRSLVLNDPRGAMSFDEADDFAARYGHGRPGPGLPS